MSRLRKVGWMSNQDVWPHRLCLMVLALATGIAIWNVVPARAQVGTPGWAPKEMPIGMWCSPPEPYITREQYRHIAAAGFSVVLPPCSGADTVERNRKILGLARETGLKVILADKRIPLAVTGVSG